MIVSSLSMMRSCFMAGSPRATALPRMPKREAAEMKAVTGRNRIFAGRAVLIPARQFLISRRGDGLSGVRRRQLTADEKATHVRGIHSGDSLELSDLLVELRRVTVHAALREFRPEPLQLEQGFTPSALSFDDRAHRPARAQDFRFHPERRE